MILRNFFVSLFMFAAPLANAAATDPVKPIVKPLFRCETEFPTTTMEVIPANSSSGDLKFHVFHHFGVQNIPITNGIVTTNDIANLQAKAEILKKLGENFSVPIKSKNCEMFGPEIYSCFSAEPFQINSLKLSGYNFTTRVVNTKIYDYDFKSHEVVFTFYFEGMSYDLPMKYSPDECRFK